MKTFLLSLLLATLPLAPETLGAQEAEKSAAPPTKNDWSRSKLTKLRGEKRTDKKRHGGAAYSRLAEKGLDWLVKHQQEDGSWSSHRLPAACANSNRKAVCDEFSHSGHVKGPEADVGLTGLALLAFAGRGNTYLEAEDAKYKTAIDRAVKWLTEVQISDEKAKAEYRGFIGREKDRKQAEDTSMYGHAIATLALCELLLGTGDKERLAAPTQAAVDWCLRAQNPGFGWHYGYSDGKSATPSTIWLSTAVLLGEECVKAGLIDLKRERFATSRTGTLSWLDAVTSSRTGAEAPGGTLTMRPPSSKQTHQRACTKP